MEIFHISKEFPPEEKYSLTDQIRRSSRSICVNLAEAYRKRQYEAHFVSKLSDCDAENSETLVWLDFAHASNYIKVETYQHLYQSAEEIGRMLNDMLSNPKSISAFCRRNNWQLPVCHLQGQLQMVCNRQFAVCKANMK
jgi:four helix bundle protein